MSSGRPLPVFPKGSIQKDGSRQFIYPADVKGRFANLRVYVFAVLAVVYVALPWVQIGGHPAVQLDIASRRFYLFGATFNAQDAWLLFFLLTGTGFALIFATTLWGRVWCGYACPQTVWLEGVFRRIERWVEGPAVLRARRDAGPLVWDKLWRKIVKHSIYFVLAAAIAHVFISYFVSLPNLCEMMTERPAQSPQAFAWAFGLTALMYINFAWFREQLCLVVCPYGRLQSLMTDTDTMVIGYDVHRGEPRGKAKKGTTKEVGDCIDCGRCVAVCPTGIDIRNGLQLECVGCAACVDACDEIMEKVDRPKGLVRYDSLNGLAGEQRQFWRPRLFLYGVLGAVGLTVATLSIRGRKPFEANLLRQQAAPYVVADGHVRNALELHLLNKRPEATHFEIDVPLPEGADVVLPIKDVELQPFSDRRLPLFVSLPAAQATQGAKIVVRVRTDRADVPEQEVMMPFAMPGAQR